MILLTNDNIEIGTIICLNALEKDSFDLLEDETKIDKTCFLHSVLVTNKEFDYLQDDLFTVGYKVNFIDNTKNLIQIINKVDLSSYIEYIFIILEMKAVDLCAPKSMYLRELFDYNSELKLFFINNIEYIFDICLCEMEKSISCLIESIKLFYSLIDIFPKEFISLMSEMVNKNILNTNLMSTLDLEELIDLGIKTNLYNVDDLVVKLKKELSCELPF